MPQSLSQLISNSEPYLVHVPITTQYQANALGRFTENNSTRQMRVEQMMEASNSLQNNIRSQKSEAERLKSELESVNQSIAKTNTTLEKVHTLTNVLLPGIM